LRKYDTHQKARVLFSAGEDCQAGLAGMVCVRTARQPCRVLKGVAVNRKLAAVSIEAGVVTNRSRQPWPVSFTFQPKKHRNKIKEI
jgi:hypothetical protein